MTTALTKQGGGFAIAPANMAELYRYCELVAQSDLAPKDFRNKPGNVMVAIQMGGELGLSPMQSIQNIAVINGRPSLWGDALLAVCLPHLDDLTESDDGQEATCRAKRGNRTVAHRFSMADAKRAGLEGKSGPWTQYPARMRQMRARSFVLRDICADVLRGVQSAEESQDTQPTEVQAEVVETKPQQPLVALEKPPEDTRLRGIPGYKLGGQVLEECTVAELGHYIGALEKLPEGKRSEKFNAHLGAACKLWEAKADAESAAVQARKQAEQPPPAAGQDAITEGLRDAVQRMREPGDDDESYLSEGAP